MPGRAAASGNRSVRRRLRILRRVTDDPPPPPETCAHNLYAASDASGRPEASDLCRNELGVFHMLDCPLFLGRPCTYYEPAPEQRSAEDELALERAAQELRQDFLSWGYTRRVRALAQPRDAVPKRAKVEAIDEPEDRGIVVRRVGAEDEPEVVAAEEEVVAEEEAATEEEPEAAPASRPELYPGQRRSEERVRGPRRARHEGEGEAGDSDEAPEEADEVVEEERPRTVAELFEQLPEAHLPDRPGPSRPSTRRGRRPRRGRSARGRPEGAGDGPSESGRPREGAAAGGDG